MIRRPLFWRLAPLLSVVLSFASVMCSQAPNSDFSSHPKYSRDRILVKFRAGLDLESRAAVHSVIGARSVERYVSLKDLEKVSLPANLGVWQALRSYRQRPEVEYAEPDYTVHKLNSPNDPLFPQMWNLLNTGQEGGTAGDDVGAMLAWNLSTGDHSVVVATIDSGIDYGHTDLIPNLFHDKAVCNGVNDGTNGCYGISTVYYTSDVFDDNGHGTHVSGIIGAVGNNALGVVGINWNVQLLTCKFLDSTGSGQISDAISCLDYVLKMKNKGYNIVATNNSWGGNQYSQALVDAIQAQQQAGILFIAAAGNEFSDNDVVPTYPGNTSQPNVISVAATTRTDAIAVFSNTGRCGTVFRLTPQGVFTTLHAFCVDSNCSDGLFPEAALILGSDGNFYGTTYEGGAVGSSCNQTVGCGSIFKITASGVLTTIYSFCSMAKCADGGLPTAPVVQGTDGDLYGTTASGGTRAGTLFKITPAGALTTLYHFCSQANCADGSDPEVGLVQGSDGNFYGATQGGGTGGCAYVAVCGIIFRITPSGVLTKLYDFCSQTNCADGFLVRDRLMQASNGKFYGMTELGGAHCESGGRSGCGTLFEITCRLRIGGILVGATIGALPLSYYVMLVKSKFHSGLADTPAEVMESFILSLTACAIALSGIEILGRFWPGANPDSPRTEP